ncbi:MAG: carboxypeptidase regulatory-like domain-containing protein [Dermatophilaceae bacterium]
MPSSARPLPERVHRPMAATVLAAAALVTTVVLAPTTVVAAAPTAANAAATISGRVTDTRGNPVSATVEVSPQGGGLNVVASTDADGRFTVTDVPPGPSYLGAKETGSEYRFEAEYWNGTESTPSYAAWAVPDGPVGGVDFVLDDATGILGTATDAAGTPLPRVRYAVFEFDESTGEWRDPQMGPLLTDERGRFWWRGTVGRTYTACFYDDFYGAEHNPSSRYGDRCWRDALTREAATTFAVTADRRRVELTQVLPRVGDSLIASEPFVTGTLAVGSTVTADPGAWRPSGVALSYQWISWPTDDGPAVDITGATAPSFSPSADLDGVTVGVRVTGALDGYRTAVQDVIVGEVGAPTPTMTGALQVTGSPTVGSTLRAVPGTITPTDEFAVSYAWTVDGRPVTDGSSSTDTFEVRPEHAGARIGARMYARHPSGGNYLHAFADTGPVAGGLTAPVPTLSAERVTGLTITANPGSWAPAPVALTYRWYRSGSEVAGATASTYRLGPVDVGASMMVRVTGSRAGYAAVDRSSAATTPILGTFAAAASTVTGTATVGGYLVANPGTWTPEPTNVGYQWRRDGLPISGATLRTYLVTPADRGRALSVTVRGTREHHIPLVRTVPAPPIG